MKAIAVFTKYNDKYILMHIEGNRAEHIYAYKELDGGLAGAIINCRIERQAENIGSSFVTYAPKMTGFINKTLKCQKVIPLMYRNDAYNEKKARFTDKLTIDGKYTVAELNAGFVKCSSKIPSDIKDKLKKRFRPIADELGIGIIIRTKTYTESAEDLAEKELYAMKDMFDDIMNCSQHSPQYTVLYRPLPECISDVLYLLDMGVTEIVTDDEDIMAMLSAEYMHVSGPVSVTDRVSLRFYEDKLLSLFNLYAMNAKLSEALERNVYLKSGARITIDNTEALTAIDVNSSENDKDGKKEETFISVNCEAAYEIARQIRLRNISGMIVIDFISMKSDIDYDKLAQTLKDAVKSDRSACRFVDFTGLKLAELVRTRRGLPLHSILRG
ncbi:MAG: ribonuclease E/G [Lachnospiraceae bacterium]|nr:ribonuclease E/G [Lachnospiraceae bacterium]